MMNRAKNTCVVYALSNSIRDSAPSIRDSKPSIGDAATIRWGHGSVSFTAQKERKYYLEKFLLRVAQVPNIQSCYT